MKIFLSALFLIFAISIAGAQSTPSTAPGTQTSVMAASSSLKIVSPTVGQKIGSTAVDVQYQMTDAGASAAPSPTYRVQLDGRDSSETLDTEYSFTGLAPGPHSATVELVDANHNPIPGSRAVVHFTTFTPGLTPAPAAGTPPTNPAPSNAAPAKPQTTGALSPPQIIKARMPLPPANPADQLPSAGGDLPLLSIVGFGVLAGGVISALRTRK